MNMKEGLIPKRKLVVGMFALYAVCLSAAGLPFGSDLIVQSHQVAAFSRTDHQPANIYRVPLLNNPITLDPASAQDLYGILVIRQLFDGLVRFSRDLFVIPALAENWRVEDQGKTYRFFLRSDATFHNGKPVTSGDVVFSLSRLLRVKPHSTIVPHLLRIRGARDYMEGRSESVEGLKAIDEKILLIHLESPYVPLLVSLAMHSASIVPQEQLGEGKMVLTPGLVGSGPFRFVHWDQNEKIRLERFPAYYREPARVDGLEFMIYPGIDVQRVWEDFRQGRIEEMPAYPQFRRELEQLEGLQWVRRPALSVQFYGFNLNHPLFRDSELRALLAQAIERPRLGSTVYAGLGEAAAGVLPPGLPGYQPDARDPSPAIGSKWENVREKINASLGPGARIEIVSNSQSPVAQAELRFVQEAWKRLGVEMEPRFIPDWNEFKEYLRSDKMQMYRHMWSADIPDPDDFLRILFASDSPMNYMHYQNPQVDRMLDEAVGILEPVTRARRYREIELLIMESNPLIPLIHPSVVMVYQPYVRDIEMTALGSSSVSYHRVWLDRRAAP